MVSCGPVKGPDDISWGAEDNAPGSAFGEILDAGNVDNVESKDENSSIGGDESEAIEQEGDPSSSQYDPDAPPPIIDLPSVWRQYTDAPIQNHPDDRRSDAYLAVIKQFGVESNPCRYTSPCGGLEDTRCNIYASDVMNAMGAHLPTKGELGLGHGNSRDTDPMPATAVQTHNWLEGEHDGWRKLNPNNSNDWALLQEHVAAGKPALTSRSDHIAVIRPDQASGLSVGNTSGLHIAQSGAYNSNSTTAGQAFGSGNFDIYIHE